MIGDHVRGGNSVIWPSFHLLFVIVVYIDYVYEEIKVWLGTI
jgi:hypothetical protein